MYVVSDAHVAYGETKARGISSSHNDVSQYYACNVVKAKKQWILLLRKSMLDV